MKEKIIIRNVMKCNKDFKGVRLGFDLASSKSMADNVSFKGYSEQSCFYNDMSVFDKITTDMIYKTVECELKPIQSVRNPMRSISVISKIYYNGRTICLLSEE